jgi:hypothetical protein
MVFLINNINFDKIIISLNKNIENYKKLSFKSTILYYHISYYCKSKFILNAYYYEFIISKLILISSKF